MRVHTGNLQWGTLLLSVVLVALAAQYGCDLTSKEPAPSVVVSPATLHGWLTEGYGTDASGYEKLVVLDVSPLTGASSYSTGHLPGSFHVDTASDLMVSRSDGIGGTYAYTDTNGVAFSDVNTPMQIATSDMMNAIFRRTGIDRNTVVAIVGDTLLNAGIAYFNFRYWGFPKERLRVLDRTKAAYVSAGYSLVTAIPPPPPPSTFTVCDLTQNTSLRATLADMMQVARGAPGAVAWDVRNQNEFDGAAGATAGPFAGKAGYAKKVAFEGHVQGAVWLPYTALLQGATILDPVMVTTTLQAKGITGRIRTHIY